MMEDHAECPGTCSDGPGKKTRSSPKWRSFPRFGRRKREVEEFVVRWKGNEEGVNR
jgi:hypothetical protein